MAETVVFDAVSIGSAINPGQLTVNSSAPPRGKPVGPPKTEAYASLHFDGAQGMLTVGAPGQVLRGIVKVGPTATGQSVLVDGKSAWVQIGSELAAGRLSVVKPVVRTDQHGTQRTELAPALSYVGEDGTLSIGDVNLGVPGVLKLGALSTRACILLDSQSASMTLGGNGLPSGKVSVVDRVGHSTIVLDAETSSLTLEGSRSAAMLMLKKAAGTTSVRIDGAEASITCGGDSSNGNVFMKNSADITTIEFSASQAEMIIGSQGVNGNLLLRDSTMVDVLSLDAADGNITCGGNGKGGDIFVRNLVAQTTVHIDGENGNITCGGNGRDGDLTLKDADGTERIHLDGSTGDIKLTGADFAEDFDIAQAPELDIEPGMIMVIGGDGGTLEPCTQAYDRRAAGVISGAGAFRPGIIMDAQEAKPGRLPVALSGKVYALVDASAGAVQCGDLLTTSSRRGHAMKAAHPERAFGSVVGKALGSLTAGQGLIPILVSLQ